MVCMRLGGSSSPPAQYPLPSEEIHSPAPHPARGIYGFVLYISAWCGLVTYLLWAIVPTPVLNQLGITYVPSKIWAIICGLLLPTLVFLFVAVVFCVNLVRFRGYGIFENVEVFVLRRLSSGVGGRREAFRKSIAQSGKGLSRGRQISEIQRRLTEFELCQTTGRDSEKEDTYVPESMIGEKFIRSNENEYGLVLRRREKDNVREKKRNAERGKLSFPLKAESFEARSLGNEDIMQFVALRQCGSEEESQDEDRGFYVEAGIYIDDYVSGTAKDLPEDDYTASTRNFLGPENAVEHIDFQLPGQRTREIDSDVCSRDSKEVNSEVEWSEETGTEDISRPVSEQSCGGCGAHFHCKDGSLPGFVPVEVLDRMDKSRTTSSEQLCKRCHLLKHHNFLLNVNVCSVDYASMMSHLRMREEALILLIVDVTDLPGSIHRQLPDIIGARKPMIVIGNKVDLLPPDAQCGYLRRFKQTIEKAIEDSGFRDRFNILHTALVSAKTGYGVEDLVTEIHLRWSNAKMSIRNDMYLVGCTNSGKSTLFNALIQSDLCKVRAVDLVERATTSVWPGTTISLLKFPVMKLSNYRLEMRRRRLLRHKAWLQKEMYSRKRLLQETGDTKYAVLVDRIQNTYKDQEEDLQPMAIRDSLGNGEESETKKKSRLSLQDPLFTKGTWCYDTPGTVNEQQVSHLLTLDELVNALPRSLLRPRTAIMKKGQSLLIGGLARIDVIDAADGVLLSTFANDTLPLQIIPTDKVEEYMKRYLGTKALVAPVGGVKRLEEWPEMRGREYVVHGQRLGGSSDIVLSSIGWCLVTTKHRVVLKAWTPEGRGLHQRSLPILPLAANLRGKREAGSQFYKVKPVEFPVNERRLAAEKKRRAYKR